MSTLHKLLSKLINLSEKAANIARVCRKDSELFKLLIEEKTEDEKNQRFFQDFKTLADVLIQETIRHEVSMLFPALEEKIKGEESNKFENKLGEKIEIKINENVNETREVLMKILDGNEAAAEALIEEIFKEVDTEESKTLPDLDLAIDLQKLGKKNYIRKSTTYVNLFQVLIPT